MEILSLEELSKIRKNNKATSEEWEIIKRYLNTGACYSKEDAITIINNIKNNEIWYKNDFVETLISKYKDAIVAMALIVTGVLTSIELVIAIVMLFKSGFLALLMCLGLMGIAIIPTTIVTQLIGGKILRNFANAVMENLDKKLERDFKLENSQNKVSESKKNYAVAKNLSQFKEQDNKKDLFIVQIEKLANKIKNANYPKSDDDVELLQNLAYEYVNHGKNWKDLTEFEKQEWINRLFAIEYDINNRVDGLISQTKKEILKKQVDAIFSEENASNLENTYQVKEEEVSNNGPKLVLDLSQKKYIKIKK